MRGICSCLCVVAQDMRPRWCCVIKNFGQGYAAFLENFPRVFSGIPKAHLLRTTPPCDLQGFGGAHYVREMEET